MKRQNATRDAVMAQNRVLVKVVSMENPPSFEEGIYSLMLRVLTSPNIKHYASNRKNLI